MALDIHTQDCEQYALITLEGCLDALTYGQLNDELQRVLSAGNTRIILDCPQLRVVSSAGLRVLLGAVKKIGDDGCLVLSRAPENIISVLDMSGFGSFINNYSDLMSAKASVTQ